MHKNAIPLTLCAALALLMLWSGIVFLVESNSYDKVTVK